MTGNEPRPRARVAEARRNRERLIEVATRAFTAGETVSLEAVAREAGVGIGTLYRHFPQREALVEAVYLDQVARLGTSATDLLGRYPPAEALRRWATVFADWALTKHGMIESLGSLMSAGRLESGQMRAGLVSIVTLFLESGRAAGDLRDDVTAEDLAATLAGVLMVSGPGDDRARIERMVALVLAGLRPG